MLSMLGCLPCLSVPKVQRRNTLTNSVTSQHVMVAVQGQTYLQQTVAFEVSPACVAHQYWF